MTARELYSQAKARLAEAGVDSPGFDAARLAERFLGLDRPGLAMHGGEAPDEGKRREFLEAVSQRAARRPLQYILGEWPFMSLTLQVGEGVLIPREDTAALVEAVAGRIGAGSRGLDLCAGSGAMTIQKWAQNPNKTFICEELDERVIPLLLFNMAVRNMGGYVLNRNALTLEFFKVYKLSPGSRFCHPLRGGVD